MTSIKNKISLNAIKTAIFTPKFSVRNVFLSLFIGIFLGYFTLGIVYGFGNATQMISDLFKSSFSNSLDQGITYLLNKIVVLGLAGIAVAIAMKANLLNIGVSGQMTFGALIGYLILNSFAPSSTTTFFLGLMFAILGGALIATITSLLKVFFKVNEVVTAIMFNWAIVFFAKYFENRLTPAGVALEHPLYIFGDSSLLTYSLIALFMFIFIAVVIWYVFTKTAIGFKITSSGESPSVAKYAGYRSNLNSVLIFTISGGISGVAGFVYFYLTRIDIPTSLTPIPYGFTGIAVALVGMNNALGILGSAVLFGVIDGPFQGLVFQNGFRTDIIQIFSAIVTYFVAISALWMYFRPVILCRKWLEKIKHKQPTLRIKKGGK